MSRYFKGILMDFNSRLKKDNAMNEKELREKYISYVNKHNLSPSSLKVYRISFIILATLIILLLGIPVLTFSPAGIFFIIVGLFFIYAAKTYKKIYNTLYKTPVPKTKSQSEKIEKRKDDIPNSNNDTIIPSAKLDEKITPTISDTSSATDDNNFKYERHHVSGTSFREKAIESLAYENSFYSLKKNDFIEMFSEDERAYQYTFAPSTVELQEELDNKYDSNAIKVVIDGVHVGYIKSDSCLHIKKLLHSDSIISISAQIHGGKYRCYYEYFDDDAMDYRTRMKTERHNYSITIVLKLRNN